MSRLEAQALLDKVAAIRAAQERVLVLLRALDAAGVQRLGGGRVKAYIRDMETCSDIYRLLSMERFVQRMLEWHLERAR